MFVEVSSVLIALRVFDQLIGIADLKACSHQLAVQVALLLLRLECFSKSLLVAFLDLILHFLIKFGLEGLWYLLSADGTALIMVQSFVQAGYAEVMLAWSGEWFHHQFAADRTIVHIKIIKILRQRGL